MFLFVVTPNTSASSAPLRDYICFCSREGAYEPSVWPIPMVLKKIISNLTIASLVSALIKVKAYRGDSCKVHFATNVFI